MKKLDNFSRCLEVLKMSDPDMACRDAIYRMGLIGQFNLSFELGWKALQAVLVMHGIQDAATGSPREIVKQGYRVGFLQNETVWLDMLKRRNIAVHVYNEDEADELVERILRDYLPVMEHLRDILTQKVAEVEEDHGI